MPSSRSSAPSCWKPLADGTPRRIRLLDEVSEGQNVRYAGADVARGAPVLAAGERIERAADHAAGGAGRGRM